MAIAQFAALLKDLEPFFNCKLEPDSNNSCLISLKEKDIEIQIDMDRTEENLLVVCRLAKLSLGRFRDTILRDALRANFMNHHSEGILAFAKKTDTLILFTQISAEHFTVERASAILLAFMEKAKIWSDALKKGESPFGTSPIMTSKFGFIR